MTPERALKAKVRKHLISIGACVDGTVHMGMGGDRLDIIAGLRGKYLEIEAKTPGNKPTPRQEQRARVVEVAGCITFWFDSFEGYLANMVLKGLIAPASK